jgi:hypothetical protein
MSDVSHLNKVRINSLHTDVKSGSLFCTFTIDKGLHYSSGIEYKLYMVLPLSKNDNCILIENYPMR